MSLKCDKTSCFATVTYLRRNGRTELLRRNQYRNCVVKLKEGDHAISKHLKLTTNTQNIKCTTNIQFYILVLLVVYYSTYVLHTYY